MAHLNETVLREAYTALARPDLDRFLSFCVPDFCFHVPGHGRLCGNYIGKEGLADLARRVMAISGNTYQEDVEAVLANDSHGVVLLRHRFQRDGKKHDYRTAHVYDIVGGKLARCHEQPRDPAAFEEAWGVAAFAS
jgi:ketosteroid isomerase-like protein